VKGAQGNGIEKGENGLEHNIDFEFLSRKLRVLFFGASKGGIGCAVGVEQSVES